MDRLRGNDMAEMMSGNTVGWQIEFAAKLTMMEVPRLVVEGKRTPFAVPLAAFPDQLPDLLIHYGRPRVVRQ